MVTAIKKTLRATESRSARVLQLRDTWFKRQVYIIRKHKQKRLVFIDETCINTKMVRQYGRCLKGERLLSYAPFGHWKSNTFIAGLRSDELIAPWIIDAPMNRQIFDAYIETQLAPCLDKGDVVILDNLSSHKSHRAAKILKDKGCWFLFLPPYSPDLNPIEMAFSKIKSHLRRIGARTIDELIQAMGHICNLFNEEECYNYFKASMYF